MSQGYSNSGLFSGIQIGRVAYGKVLTRITLCVCLLKACYSISTIKKEKFRINSTIITNETLDFSRRGSKNLKVLLPNLSQWDAKDPTKRRLLVSGNDVQILSMPPGLKGPLLLLDASNNSISSFAPFVHAGPTSVTRMILRKNNITQIPQSLCENVNNLEMLDLSQNQITEITEESFRLCTHLRVLILSSNKIRTVSHDAFRNLQNVQELYLSSNKIKSLPHRLLKGLAIKRLFITDNAIFTIDKIFEGARRPPDHVYTYNNPIRVIQLPAESGLSDITRLYVSCTHLQRFTSESIAPDLNCAPSTDLEISTHEVVVTYSLLGFQCIQNGSWYRCKPCSPGSFNDAASTCRLCPPGGFYQDEYGKSSCKLCPPGTAVKQGGGRSLFDCKSCPPGTNMSIQAGTRSCNCLPGYARTCRFCKCTKCNQRSMRCNDGYQDLRPGYYWLWDSIYTRRKYMEYVANLRDYTEKYNSLSNNLTFTLPKPHPCPNTDACLGGINATCAHLYKGPLCNICNDESYRYLNQCYRCPHLVMAALQIAWVLVFFVLFCVLVNWGDKKYTSKRRSRSLADIILSSLKTILGFCQILSVILSLLSHIRWPKFLIDISHALHYIDMRILPVQSLKCILSSVEITLGTEMALSLAATVFIPIFMLIFLRIRLAIFDYQPSEINTFKKTCYRSITLFVFATYLFTTRRVFQMLPPACTRICYDAEDKNCEGFVRADLRLQCTRNDPIYVAYVRLAYGGLFLLMGLPVFIFFVIKKHRKNKPTQLQCGTYETLFQLEATEKDDPSEFAVRFMCESYKENCWYWELVEMFRKVAFTFGAEFFGSGTRTNLAIYITLSGLFIVIYAYKRPIKDKTEHFLQMFSFTVIFLNLCAGVLLKVSGPSRVPSDDAGDHKGLAVILVCLNILVISSIVLRMTFAVLRSIKFIVDQRVTCCVALSRFLKQVNVIASGSRVMKA